MKVELLNIHKHFGPRDGGVLANDDVSMTVEAGTIHGLLGENGAGKSTLVKMLSGFISRDSGSVLLHGVAAEIKTPTDAIQQGVGMLFQEPMDFPPLTVIENFMAGRQDAGLFTNRRAAEREFRTLATQFNFALYADEHVSNMTVGERQQLEMLRLLSLGVQVLVLDEPTTGISAMQKTALFAALKRLAQQGKSVIFVSHKLEDVEELCDEVTVLRRGQLIGTAKIPCPASQLVEMMFGKALAAPIKPSTARDDLALELRDVVIKTDTYDLALKHLAVRRGEVIGIAGLEGSGQQPFLLACAGVAKCAQGALHIQSSNALAEMSHKSYRDFLRSGVCYLPADRLRDGLVAGLTIRDHVSLRAQQSVFVNQAESLRVAETAISTFNIRGKPETNVERLSGGNQQRTQLALMPNPLNLILMEHPTRGLDIESTLWVWQQLIARCQQGTAIVFASSDLDEIMQYSDRVLVFSGGRVSEPIEASKLSVDTLGQMIGGKF
ncbi:MAG: ATP-binding cassette domain-containing protein [Anaerolineae bacterium]|nr:ATP-binding cassette domain-containing protein [Anaerolineae bacterium]